MSKFHDKLISEIDHFTPIKTYLVNPKKDRWEPWLTAGIHISIHKSKKLYYEILCSKSDDRVRSRYKDYTKTLQRVKRKAKFSYYENKCKSYRKNTKKLWGIINEICSTKNDKSCLIDCLKINDVLEYDAKKITNKFGKYFSSVGKKFADRVAEPKHGPMYYCHKIPRNEKSLFMTPCTEVEVLNLIRKLPTKMSSGHDNISNVLLKTIGNFIRGPLLTYLMTLLAVESSQM